MTVFCAAIAPEKLDDFWNDITPFLSMALEHEHGGLDLDLIYKYIKEKYFLLVIVYDVEFKKKFIVAVQTIELRKTDDGLLCNLVTTAGVNLDNWQDALSDFIDKIARKENCYAIHTRGRFGWLRQLKRNGYEPLYFIAEKKLEH